MRIQLVHAPLPAAGGKTDEGLMEFLKEKWSVIVMEEDELNLCYAQVIVAGVARVDRHRQFTKLYESLNYKSVLLLI